MWYSIGYIYVLYECPSSFGMGVLKFFLFVHNYDRIDALFYIWYLAVHLIYVLEQAWEISILGAIYFESTKAACRGNWALSEKTAWFYIII